MSIGDLVPWKSREHRGLARRTGGSPISTLQKEMNRLFEDFFGEMTFPSFETEWDGLATLTPSIDVSQTDDEVQVTAELPGIEEKDIDVTLSDGVLTIRGEKRHEEDRKDKKFHHVERSYGSFQRSTLLPAEVDSEKVEAVFRNGVLTVTLPKVETTDSSKKIAVHHAD